PRPAAALRRRRGASRSHPAGSRPPRACRRHRRVRRPALPRRREPAGGAARSPRAARAPGGLSPRRGGRLVGRSMRFSYAHKMSTYLMVWSAFLAVALSGELSGLAALLGGPAIAASWFWEPPRIRHERWDPVFTGATLLFFGYSVLLALTAGEVLLVATSFILFLLVIKLLQRRSCRDYLHVYVLSFLLLVAGTVLNAELTYGIFFLGFVVSSTWALTLFHLRREMEDNFLLKHSDTTSSER